MTAPASAYAASWDVRTGVSVSETYTDNVDLAPPGQEESDLITSITPLISIRTGEGAEGRGRINFDLDYSLETFTIGGSSVPNSLNHQLQLSGTAEVVEQMIFVDFGSSVSQQNIANTGRVSDDNIADTGNRTDVITFTISPYIRHHLGNYADTEARWSYDNVINQDVSGSDSNAGRLSGSVTSGSYFGRLFWGLDWSREVIDNDDGTETKFGRFDASGGYQINRKFSVDASAGVDDNSFASSQGSIDGVRWRFGGTWTPTSRTAISAGYGSQFSGSSVSFDVTHRSRHTVWSASLLEDTSTTRDVQLGRELFPLFDAFGEPVFDDTGTPILTPIDAETITNEVIVRNTFRGAMDWQRQRSDLGLTVFNEQRTFQVSGNEETVFGFGARAGHRLSRKTNVSVDTDWQLTELGSGGLDRTRWTTGVSLTHRFHRNLNGTFSYRYQDQSSDDPLNEFTENRATARVSLDF